MERKHRSTRRRCDPSPSGKEYDHCASFEFAVTHLDGRPIADEEVLEHSTPLNISIKAEGVPAFLAEGLQVLMNMTITRFFEHMETTGAIGKHEVDGRHLDQHPVTVKPPEGS